MAHYNLIFQGKIVDGASLEEVKNNISRLFKTNAAKTEILFSGKTIVIKKNLDSAATKKYLAIVTKAGAVIKAVKITESKTIPSSPPPPGKPLSPGLSSLINYNSSKTISAEATQEQAEDNQMSDAGNDLQLAPPGSDIIDADAHNQHDSIDIPDIGYLTMSVAQSGSLAEITEKKLPADLPDISMLSMSEANSGSMEEFATQVKAAILPDISELSVARQDDTPLSAESPDGAVVELPDTSDLSMSGAQEGSFAGATINNKSVAIPDTSHLEMLALEKDQQITGKAVFQID